MPATSGRDGLTGQPPASSCMWIRSASAVWRNVLDDVMVADGQGHDHPFALAGGLQLWQHLGTPHTAAELAVLLDTDQAGAVEAVEQLLVELCGRGIVRRYG